MCGYLPTLMQLLLKQSFMTSGSLHNTLQRSWLVNYIITLVHLQKRVVGPLVAHISTVSMCPILNLTDAEQLFQSKFRFKGRDEV